MKKLLLSVMVLCGSQQLMAQQFRGLPYFAQIESLQIAPAPSDPSLNHAQVCYRFATTIPILDYTDFVSQSLKGAKVKRKDTDGSLINGDTQPHGVEFKFSFQGFNFYAYLNSEARRFTLPQFEYFNSAVRNVAGVPKPLQLTSYELNYQAMIDPQYEWVRSCENIPFGKAFSERYVRSLFSGPGPIGAIKGTTQFNFNVFLPLLFGSEPLSLPFNPSEYVVPVFGLSALETDDQRMISLSHYVNSLNAVKENLDEATLNKYLMEHTDIVQAFENHYGIQVELPLDTERLIELIKDVAGIKNNPVERTEF